MDGITRKAIRYKMNDYNIDMHMHTVCSDGSHTPDDVLMMCDESNLGYVSITDHDCVDAYGMISYDSKCIIIPGIEMTTSYRGETIEVLGYGIDVGRMHDILEEIAHPLYERRIISARLRTKALLERGVRISNKFVSMLIISPESLFDPSVCSSTKAILEEIRSHEANERFFDASEFERDVFAGNGEYDESVIRTYFDRHMLNNPKSKLYCDVSGMFPPLDDVIGYIHSCNGKAFVAHLYQYSDAVSSNIEDIIDNHDIDGIECVYPMFSKKQTEYLLSLCEEKGLLSSGGSDFHGWDKRPDNMIGCGTSQKPIPSNIVQDWIDNVMVFSKSS